MSKVTEHQNDCDRTRIQRAVDHEIRSLPLTENFPKSLMSLTRVLKLPLCNTPKLLVSPTLLFPNPKHL